MSVLLSFIDPAAVIEKRFSYQRYMQNGLIMISVTKQTFPFTTPNGPMGEQSKIGFTFDLLLNVRVFCLGCFVSAFSSVFLKQRGSVKEFSDQSSEDYTKHRCCCCEIDWFREGRKFSMLRGYFFQCLAVSFFDCRNFPKFLSNLVWSYQHV